MGSADRKATLVARARVIQVIEVETMVGTGEENDPTRPVYSYWKTGSGETGQTCLAVRDHWKELQGE